MIRKYLAWAVIIGVALPFISFIALLIYAAPIILIGLIIAVLAIVALGVALTGLSWALEELDLL
jgi:hypothetical protein